jgi:BASS family bile acid:Na+ symporter
MSPLLARLANLFPVWVLAGALLALVEPRWFTWFRGPLIVWGLGLIMLGMGLTLRFEDFRRTFQMPRAILVGLVAQFTVMPALGWAIAVLLRLPTPFAVGLILVSCCPGGTASNIVTYIAQANVALSVLLTMASTFAAVLFTPLLTALLAGQYVPVEAGSLIVSTAQVVLLPVIAGVAINHLFPKVVAVALPAAPLVSVFTVALIVASIVGQNADAIRSGVALLLIAVFLLHAGGFMLGYGVAWLLGYARIIRQTLAIEVGMQNSGLGVVLARKHFADPLTAVPSALSSVMHSVLGSILAAIWRWQRSRVSSNNLSELKKAAQLNVS